MRAWLIGLVSVACGIAGWEAVRLLHPAQEPWDVRAYWVAVYPGMMIVSGILGYLAPSQPWRWGLAMTMGQGLWLLLQTTLKSGMPNLWPISLLLFAILALPCMAAAFLGAFLGRRRAG